MTAARGHEETDATEQVVLPVESFVRIAFLEQGNDMAVAFPDQVFLDVIADAADGLPVFLREISVLQLRIHFDE